MFSRPLQSATAAFGASGRGDRQVTRALRPPAALLLIAISQALYAVPRQSARDPLSVPYITSQILCEFYSVITNPRRILTASSSAEALSIISALLALPGLRILPIPAHAVAGWIDLLINASACHGEQRI